MNGFWSSTSVDKVHLINTIKEPGAGDCVMPVNHD